MANKILIWGAIFITSLIFGTAIGSIFCEYNSLTYIFASIAFSPLSLVIRVFASLHSIMPNTGIPLWTNAIGNFLTFVCTVLSVISTVCYFKTGKFYFAIGFGVSFFILNISNINHFLAMMSI
ncbi:hypothetical protein DSLASN_18480 [Desulfoluna limicola]|uniref:Uncharacterized protein n=1 Tax=Desulfoluna limicola TaxID=2810562 RepID=A0ABN6F401_9BACT|nr:hypothetical protein [Desulfoluna limicola]BCS96216.1 hypothetical protein DSLASN_18480 [Desulfoluna limicola]